MSDTAALGAWRRRAQGGSKRRRQLPSRTLVGAVGIALVCAVVGAHGLGGQRAPSRKVSAAPERLCPALTAPVHADVDGDGCDEEVSFTDGVLTAGSVRLRVGVPGDQVALGRWTCGPAAVALLRPATGEVFRFDGWASPTRTVPAVA